MKLNIKTLCSIGALVLTSTAVFGMNDNLEKGISMSWSKISQLDLTTRDILASDMDAFLKRRSDICNNAVELFSAGTSLWVAEINRQMDAYGSVDTLLKEHFDEWYSVWSTIIRDYGEELVLIDLSRKTNFLVCGLYPKKYLKQLDTNRELNDDLFVKINTLDRINKEVEMVVEHLRIAKEMAEAERLRIAEETAEAERQRIDEAIESATQMFEEAEGEAAQAASQVIARESHYSRFGQFFKSMWSRFTNSRLGRVLKNIGQTLFSNR